MGQTPVVNALLNEASKIAAKTPYGVVIQEAVNAIADALVMLSGAERPSDSQLFTFTSLLSGGSPALLPLLAKAWWQDGPYAGEDMVDFFQTIAEKSGFNANTRLAISLYLYKAINALPGDGAEHAKKLYSAKWNAYLKGEKVVFKVYSKDDMTMLTAHKPLPMANGKLPQSPQGQAFFDGSSKYWQSYADSKGLAEGAVVSDAQVAAFKSVAKPANIAGTVLAGKKLATMYGAMAIRAGMVPSIVSAIDNLVKTGQKIPEEKQQGGVPPAEQINVMFGNSDMRQARFVDQSDEETEKENAVKAGAAVAAAAAASTLL